MIFITGDTHNRVHISKIDNKNFPIQDELTRDDYLIVCGDFGFLWNYGPNDLHWLEWLSQRSFTILWIDGNHENFELLHHFSVKQWKGGSVRFIRENIIHLERGQIFEIDGLSFFTFGGAHSIDKDVRVEGKSWWPQELPTKEEMGKGLEVLAKADYKVDYIITHAAPQRFLAELVSNHVDTDEKEFNEYLDMVYEKTEFKKWYFGHYHVDKNLDSKTRALFHDIVLLETDDR